ncbi:MAG: hypothetical protein ACJ8DI_04250 [Ktedonobacteraceae bacterium]
MVVLPEEASLTEIPARLLAPGVLPELWNGAELTLQEVYNYFSGTKRIVMRTWPVHPCGQYRLNKWKRSFVRNISPLSAYHPLARYVKHPLCQFRRSLVCSL